MSRILLIFLFFYLTSGIENISSQEILIDLEKNPLIQSSSPSYSSLKKSSQIDSLSLPFIDDFSDSQVIPNTSLWTDRFAFINNSYPVYPISAGVATLDAIDNTGAIYLNAAVYPFQADYLTSGSIDLALNPSDSIYLSFFYQPKGLGEMPETGDSLLLDFFSVSDSIWNNVWSAPGDTSIKNFKRVMIKIDNPSYLHNGFRFRFRNLASLFFNSQFADSRSNSDHWNIDYIKLDKNRSIKDTVLRDVTFINPMLSLLKDYETIPWKHFESAYTTQQRPYIPTVILNHDSIDRNVKTNLIIKDLISGYTYITTPTSNDILSGDSIHFLFTYDYPFNFGVGDYGAFEIKAILGTDAFDYKPNDTLKYTQYFNNYYSLDDGSSEAGYGLRGDGTQNSSVAVKFNTFLKDSLRAVDFYFNHTLESLNLNYYFSLNVWSDSNGQPGNLLVSQMSMRPVYSDSLNKFVRYRLDHPIELSGVFYIGWQKTVDKLENIGFDKNRINNSKIFYTDNGIWRTSSFPGSLMIRPVLSKDPLIISVPTVPLPKKFIIYPNPADKEFFVQLTDNTFETDFSISLYDLRGRKIRTAEYGTNVFYTGDLEEGIYIVKINNGITYSAKIIISH